MDHPLGGRFRGPALAERLAYFYGSGMVSTTFRGADTAELRGLAQRLHGSAQRLTAMSSATTRSLAGTDWYGRDAERFRADWNTRWRPALAAVADALERAGDRLYREAAEQDRASRGGGSVPAGGSAVGTTGAHADDAASGTNTDDAAPAGRAGWTGTLDNSWQTWNTWNTWYSRLATAIGAAPFVAAAVRWSDAPLIGPRTWTRLAGEWTAAHLPTAGLGRTLTALNLASFGADVYATTTAAMNGDVLGALENGIPAALAVGSASPNPWIALPSMAGNAGWTIGSWIYDEYAVQIGDGIEATIDGIEEFNSSPVGIWIGDHIVGPTGDSLVGAWDALAGAISDPVPVTDTETATDAPAGRVTEPQGATR